MATITATWTENVAVTAFDDVTPADTVTSVTSIDVAAAGYDCIVVQLKIIWHASATDYANVFVYASPDSGTTDDTIAVWSQRLTANAGATEYISFVLQDLPFVNIAFENQSNQEHAGISGIYAGRKWTSA